MSRKVLLLLLWVLVWCVLPFVVGIYIITHIEKPKHSCFGAAACFKED